MDSSLRNLWSTFSEDVYVLSSFLSTSLEDKIQEQRQLITFLNRHQRKIVSKAALFKHTLAFFENPSGIFFRSTRVEPVTEPKNYVDKIRDLPAHLKNVVILKDVLNFTDEEIVEILSINWSAFRSRLHRARTELLKL